MAFRGMNWLEAAGILQFLHTNTRKSAEILVARAIGSVLISVMGVKELTLIRNKED